MTRRERLRWKVTLMLAAALVGACAALCVVPPASQAVHLTFITEGQR